MVFKETQYTKKANTSVTPSRVHRGVLFNLSDLPFCYGYKFNTTWYTHFVLNVYALLYTIIFEFVWQKFISYSFCGFVMVTFDLNNLTKQTYETSGTNSWNYLNSYSHAIKYKLFIRLQSKV